MSIIIFSMIFVYSHPYNMIPMINITLMKMMNILCFTVFYFFLKMYRLKSKEIAIFYA